MGRGHGAVSDGLGLGAACHAESLFDERLHGSEFAVALPQQFLELEDELRDRRGWWVDREEAFLDSHQRQVERARLVRLGMARAKIELRQDALGLISRFVHGDADILMKDADGQPPGRGERESIPLCGLGRVECSPRWWVSSMIVDN